MRTLLLSLLLVGCAPGEPPRPPSDPEVCAPVCAHLRELGSPAGDPTPAGATCEDVCREVQASQLNAIDGACILGATSREEAEAC